MHRLLIVAVFLLAGCLDLSLPALPGPGSVTGRVVYTPPGRSLSRPAAGATVTLLGSGLTLTTSPEGSFTLDGLVPTTGVLLIRFDLDGDDTFRRQRLVHLDRFDLRPNRVNVLPDVSLTELGAVTGTVLRGDVLPATEGHAGIAVFVPAGPWTTFTTDEGRFVLDGLPEGGVEVAFFAAGLRARSTGSLALRGGETLDLGRIVLERDPRGAQPGSVTGALTFLPPTDVGAARVTLSGNGQPVDAPVQSSGSFRADAALPGLYTMRAERAGYTTALVPNVVVLPAETTDLGTVALSTGAVAPLPRPQPPPDAGQRDAGAPMDAGADAGLDAGIPVVDAGVDAGLRCVLNRDCALDSWCDDGVCRAQCATSGDCTNGRRCDTRTGVCVRPCSGGCAAFEVCDVSADAGSDAGLGACVRPCDSTYLCPLGSRCLATNVCGPECFVTSDCASGHATCQAGQCVFDGTCTLDLDCPSDELCLLGQCRPRPTTRIDGGADAGLMPFGCGAACDCRLGEVCTGGLCLADVRPTVYLAADGGGDGTSPLRASSSLEAFVADAGPGAVLALRSGDVFAFDGGLSLAAGVELSGGWRACSPTRWVRDVQASTSLVRTSAGPVVNVPGGGVLRPDVRISGFDVFAPTPPCTAGLVNVRGAPRARLERLSGAFPAFDCSAAGGMGNGGDLVRVVDSDDVLVRDVRLAPSGNTQGTLSVAWLSNSDGRLERLELDPQSTHATIRAVRIEGNQRTVFLDGVLVGDRAAVDLDVGLSLDTSVGAVARNVSIAFARKSGSGNFTSWGVRAFRAPLVLEASAIGSAGFTGQTFPFLNGIDSTTGLLTLRDVVVVLPGGTGDTARGVLATGSPLVAERLTVRGGGSRFTVSGLAIVGISSGTNRIVDSTIDVGGDAVSAYGLTANLVSGTAGLTVLRSRIQGSTTTLDGRGAGVGIQVDQAAVLVDRSRVHGIGGATSYGIDFQRGATAEVVSSYVYSGPCVASADVQSALRLWSSNGVLVVDSTLDAQGGFSQAAPGAAIHCPNPSGPVVVRGSLLNGGLAPTRRIISGIAGACSNGSNYTGNWFTVERSGAPVRSDDLVNLVLDGGTMDARGNRLMPNAVCLERPGPSPVLAAGSPCIDQGSYSLRSTGEAVVTDIDGRSRDAGLGPDVGCFERP